MKRAVSPYINGVRVGPAQYGVDMKTDTFDATLIETALSVLNANCGGRVVTLDEVKERING